MYSWEIEQLIRAKNFLLDLQECSDVIDPEKSPQVCHVKYESYDNSMEVDTKDNYHFKFKIKIKDTKK